MSKDSQLQQAVITELGWEPSVDSGHIGVSAHDGVVTLNGHVQHFSQKLAAEKAAARVKGVRAVAEEIEVKLPFDIKRGDEDIAAAAIERLAGTPRFLATPSRCASKRDGSPSVATSNGTTRRKPPPRTSACCTASSASPISSGSSRRSTRRTSATTSQARCVVPGSTIRTPSRSPRRSRSS